MAVFVNRIVQFDRAVSYYWSTIIAFGGQMRRADIAPVIGSFSIICARYVKWLGKTEQVG